MSDTSAGDGQPIDETARLMGSENAGVRAAAVSSPEGLGCERTGEGVDAALVVALDDQDSGVRKAAAEALGGREGKGVIDALVRALGDEDPSVRAAAALGLSYKDGEGVTDALVKALSDEDPSVRAAAARGLAVGQGEAVVPALIEALSDRDPSVRRESARGLAGEQGVVAFPALVNLLNDVDHKVAAAAAECLKSEEDRAVPALVDIVTRYEQGEVQTDMCRGALISLGRAVSAGLRRLAGGGRPANPEDREAAASRLKEAVSVLEQFGPRYVSMRLSANVAVAEIEQTLSGILRPPSGAEGPATERRPEYLQSNQLLLDRLSEFLHTVLMEEQGATPPSNPWDEDVSDLKLSAEVDEALDAVANNLPKSPKGFVAAAAAVPVLLGLKVKERAEAAVRVLLLKLPGKNPGVPLDTQKQRQDFLNGMLERLDLRIRNPNKDGGKRFGILRAQANDPGSENGRLIIESKKSEYGDQKRVVLPTTEQKPLEIVHLSEVKQSSPDPAVGRG